ncbi:MAG: hypothetical protein ACOZAR_02605 [Patescibacteria group bacterium]
MISGNKAKIFSMLFALGLSLGSLFSHTQAYPSSFNYEAETLNTSIGQVQYYGGDQPYTVMKGDVATASAGYLTYGPYSTNELPFTPYRVTFKIRILSGSALPVARLELFNYGNELLTERELNQSDFTSLGEFENISLDFIRPDIGSMEYRVWFYDNADVELDKITTTKLSSSSSEIYESEDLFRNIGNKINDATASGGKAVKVLSSAGAGYMQYGPYTARQQYNNAFQATFKLKTSDNSSSSEIARVECYNSHGAGEWSYKSIKGTDFTANDTYQEFNVNFSRNNEGTMEYRVFVFGLADITADKVEVNKITQNTMAYQSEDLPSAVGTIVSDQDAYNGQARLAQSNDIGYLQYGPYTLEQTYGDNYQAVFRLKTNNINSNSYIARIEALNHNGTGEWIFRNIKASDFAKANNFEDFSLDFSRTNNGSMEYRVYIIGNSDNITLTSDMVTVYKKVNSDWVFEAEQSPSNVGNIVLEQAASNGKARQATKLSNSEGFMVYGPYTDDLPHDKSYQAVFRMKTATVQSEANFARIEFVNPGGNALPVTKIIKGTDFVERNTWYDFPITFARRSGGSVELRVWFYDQADIFVDKITVTEFSNQEIVYEAENNNLGLGSAIADSMAGNGIAIKSLSASGAGYVIYGPYTVDQTTGNYQATFSVKCSNCDLSGSNMVRLEAYNQGGTGNMVWQNLNNDSLKSTYRNFTLNFYRTGEGTMEYRVYTYGNADIIIDKITVKKI